MHLFFPFHEAMTSKEELQVKDGAVKPSTIDVVEKSNNQVGKISQVFPRLVCIHMPDHDTRDSPSDEEEKDEEEKYGNHHREWKDQVQLKEEVQREERFKFDARRCE